MTGCAISDNHVKLKCAYEQKVEEAETACASSSAAVQREHQRETA